MLQAVGFIGDFHPVAVHFPIALLPTILLLKLYGWRWPQPWLRPVCGALLLCALAFCALAVALGLTNRAANGHHGAAVDSHALFAYATLSAVLLACLLHYRAAELAAWLRARHAALAAVGTVLLAGLRGLWWALKWLLIILLFPLLLLYWLVRALWRRTLGPRSAALYAARLRPRLAAAAGRLRGGLDRLRGRLSGHAAAELAFALSLVLVLLTGLKGANLSHGEGHLTRNMPAPLAALFGADERAQANAQLDRAFFEHKLLPAFRRSCVKCHGAEKQRAGLRLDAFEPLLASGVVHWQDPYGSELVRRLLLPRDHPSAMPPAGRSRELRNDDLAAVIAWLQGHSLESLASQSGGLAAELRQLADRLPPIEADALAALNAIAGLRVMRLVTDTDLLVVNLSHVPPQAMADAVRALQPHAAHIVDLSWSGRSTTAAGLALLGSMKNLRRLDLSRSNVRDADLATLSALQSLRRLNLSGTAVALSDAELQALLPGLQTVHLPSQAAARTDNS